MIITSTKKSVGYFSSLGLAPVQSTSCPVSDPLTLRFASHWFASKFASLYLSGQVLTYVCLLNFTGIRFRRLKSPSDVRVTLPICSCTSARCLLRSFRVIIFLADAFFVLPHLFLGLEPRFPSLDSLSLVSGGLHPHKNTNRGWLTDYRYRRVASPPQLMPPMNHDSPVSRYAPSAALDLVLLFPPPLVQC